MELQIAQQRGKVIRGEGDFCDQIAWGVLRGLNSDHLLMINGITRIGLQSIAMRAIGRFRSPEYLGVKAFRSLRLRGQHNHLCDAENTRSLRRVFRRSGYAAQEGDEDESRAFHVFSCEFGEAADLSLRMSARRWRKRCSNP